MEHQPYIDDWRPRNHDPSRGEFHLGDEPGAYRESHELFGAYHTHPNPSRYVGRGIIPDGRGFHRVDTGQMHQIYDPDVVREHLIAFKRGEIHPQLIEPRLLHGTQGGVTQRGMQYYMQEGNDYQRAGVPFADQDNVGNRVPVIYQHEGLGRRYVLTGHHRATAAILKGQPVRGLLIKGSHDVKPRGR